jgi:hypothetical protein
MPNDNPRVFSHINSTDSHRNPRHTHHCFIVQSRKIKEKLRHRLYKPKWVRGVCNSGCLIAMLHCTILPRVRKEKHR